MSLIASRSTSVARRMMTLMARVGRQIAWRQGSHRCQSERDIRRGQIAGSHQKHVNRSCGAASLVDRPNDERLPAAAIATGKNLRQARRELAVLRFVVRPRVALDAEHLADVLLGPLEA